MLDYLRAKPNLEGGALRRHEPNGLAELAPPILDVSLITDHHAPGTVSNLAERRVFVSIIK